jgi:hypothetical protein
LKLHSKLVRVNFNSLSTASDDCHRKLLHNNSSFKVTLKKFVTTLLLKSHAVEFTIACNELVEPHTDHFNGNFVICMDGRYDLLYLIFDCSQVPDILKIKVTLQVLSIKHID